jgi:hypothetical protein
MKVLKKVFSVILIGLGLSLAYPFVLSPDFVSAVFLVFALMFVFVGVLNLIGLDDLERKLIKIPTEEKLEKIIMAGKSKFCLKGTIIFLAEYVIVFAVLFPMLSFFDSFYNWEFYKYSGLVGLIFLPIFALVVIRYFMYLWNVYKLEYDKMTSE